MNLIFKPINSTKLKNNLANILDNISNGKEAQIIQRVSGKEEAVILSYKTLLNLYEEKDSLIRELNEVQLKLAESQFDKGAFETFTVNADGSRTYV